MMPPALTIVEGAVSAEVEHIALSYGSFVKDDSQPFPTVARVAPPQDGVVVLELLVDDLTTGVEEIMAQVRRQVRWLFVDKGEDHPWAYARHHCTTAANIYSQIHWGWVPGSNDNRS